jgi:hypothetical protein
MVIMSLRQGVLKEIAGGCANAIAQPARRDVPSVTSMQSRPVAPPMSQIELDPDFAISSKGY